MWSISASFMLSYIKWPWGSRRRLTKKKVLLLLLVHLVGCKPQTRKWLWWRGMITVWLGAMYLDWLTDNWLIFSRGHSGSVLVFTIRRRGALLLIQHQLLHLLLQVLLVNGCRVKSITHKLGHPRTRRHLLFVIPLRLGVTQTHSYDLCEDLTSAHLQFLTFWMSLMETGGVLGLTLSTKTTQ